MLTESFYCLDEIATSKVLDKGKNIPFAYLTFGAKALKPVDTILVIQVE